MEGAARRKRQAACQGTYEMDAPAFLPLLYLKTRRQGHIDFRTWLPGPLEGVARPTKILHICRNGRPPESCQ